MERKHTSELDVAIITSEDGLIPITNYAVENVSGKLIAERDDLLTYRIRFPEGKGPHINETAIVKLCPVQSVNRRRDGLPECGFMLGLDLSQQQRAEAVDFVATTCYSVVVDKSNKNSLRMKDIYFVLEDVNLESTGAPRWRVCADASDVLSTTSDIAGRWTPLKPTHPDPTVDPGVPIEFRPQRTPAWFWFRSRCEHSEIFKGKLSASTAWKFLGGKGHKAYLDDKEFKGNHMTRYGRMAEPYIALATLIAYPTYTIQECGSYPHATISDMAGAPDGIIIDNSRSFDTLPSWYKKLITEDPTVKHDEIDWTKGVFEAKNMLFMDKAKKGPILKDEYLFQLYIQMMCTGTYWGELYRHCNATHECRMFRVYRRPDLTRRIEACIKRMRSEMIGGTPYAVAVDHETNRAIIADFKKQTAFYNEPGTKTPRYRTVAWPLDKINELERRISRYDIVASAPGESIMSIAEINSSGGATSTSSKKRKKSGASPSRKTALPRGDVEELAIVKDAIPMSKDNMDRWSDIDATNKEINRCIKNGDWHELVDGQILKAQIIRYVELEKQIGIEKAVRNENGKRTRPDEDDGDI